LNLAIKYNLQFLEKLKHELWMKESINTYLQWYSYLNVNVLFNWITVSKLKMAWCADLLKTHNLVCLPSGILWQLLRSNKFDLDDPIWVWWFNSIHFCHHGVKVVLRIVNYILLLDSTSVVWVAGGQYRWWQRSDRMM